MDRLWTVVLAAGAGRRLAEVTGGVPKQFWRGLSGRSLLEATVDRFSLVAPRDRTVVVIGYGHRAFLTDSPIDRQVAAIAVQPLDRGTATGVRLGILTAVAAGAGEDDVLVVTPSDHGIADQVQFRRAVVGAVRHVRTHEGPVVFGAQPTAPCSDYGWITPGQVGRATQVKPVEAFVEKPAPEIARQLFDSGAVWNTMVVVARVRIFRRLFDELVPELAGTFTAAEHVPEPERPGFLAAAYQTLHSFDFSHDVLRAARGLSTCIWPATVGWSDLGTPERLFEWQHRMNSHAPQGSAVTAA